MYLSRSQYEYGDPVFETLARAEQRDHEMATARGHRLILLADRAVDALVGRGVLTEVMIARRELFHLLADALYGCASIHVPDFSDERSLEALRRGKD